MRQSFILAHPEARRRALQAVQEAPSGTRVGLREAKRTDAQSNKFHAICTDFAHSAMEWAGKRRTKEQWKVLLVSGHAVATGSGAEMIPGLEGEFVNIRESTALMSVSRGSSLIEYSVALAQQNNVLLREYEKT
jgi:hypothetical protein